MNTIVYKMIEAVLSEFIGAFVFILVILVTGDPFSIAVALLAVIVGFGNISGGHINPAVSTVILAKGGINWITYLFYVIAQVLGGLGALLWWNLTTKMKQPPPLCERKSNYH